MNLRNRRRFNSRRMLVEPLEDRRVLATFIVSTTADDGDGSLRNAVALANASPGFDDIVFDASLENQLIELTSEEILITDEIRIDGSSLTGGATVDLSSADPTPNLNNGDGIRAFRTTLANEGQRVEFVSLSILSGDVSGPGGAIYGASLIESSFFGDNSSTAGGGAVASLSLDNSTNMTMTIRDSQFTNNSTDRSGGALEMRGVYTATAISGSIFANNEAAEKGGAIHADTFMAPFAADDSTFSDNIAGTDGGGLYARIYGYRDIELTNLTITGNDAGADGGGMAIMGTYDGQIEDSRIEGNAAAGNGGGAAIDNNNSGFSVNNSTISGNTAVAIGGGMYVRLYDAGVNVSSSTISNNSAGGDGGGVGSLDGTCCNQTSRFRVRYSTVSNNSSGGDGGGINNIGVLANSTVSGNQAAGKGGGVSTYGGEITFATIVDNLANSDGSNLTGDTGGGLFAINQSGPVQVSHSIVARNMSIDGLSNSISDDTSGEIESLRADWSLIQTNRAVVLEGSNNLLGIDPQLAALADNGGPTETHLPESGSPVIDAGDPLFDWTGRYDQRGETFGRFRDGNALADIGFDLGAVEVQSVNVAPIAMAGDDLTTKTNTAVMLDGTGSSDPDAGPAQLTYSWTIITGPTSNATFDDANSGTPSFTSDVAGEFLIALTVSDGIDTDTDSLTVTVTENNIPTAVTTGSRSATIIGIPALLTGEESNDVDGDPIETYTWEIVTLPSGSNATLADPTAVSTGLNPDVTGIYEVELVVTDPAGNESTPARHRLSVEAGPVSAGGPYARGTGEDLQLIVLTTDPLDESTQFAWDLDGDGEFDDAMGRSPLISAKDWDGLLADQGIVQIAVAATTDPAGETFVDYSTVTQISAGLTTTWHNETLELDVDNSGIVAPLDALLAINEINDRLYSDTNGVLPLSPETAPAFIDTNDDGLVSPLDALLVINGLSSDSRSQVTESPPTPVIDRLFASDFEKTPIRSTALRSTLWFDLLDDDE